MLERTRYWIALLTWIGVPPALLFWLLVHPFARFWRRFGAPKSYSILLPVLIFAGFGLYRLRHPVFSLQYGLQWPLVLFSLLLCAFAVALGIARHRVLKDSVLLGLPELSRRDSGQLITTGIYARIRHPRYVEGVFGLLATALFANYLALYLVWLCYLPVIWWVVVLEERELEGRFGEEYRRYRQRVPRFVPKRRF